MEEIYNDGGLGRLEIKLNQLKETIFKCFAVGIALVMLLLAVNLIMQVKTFNALNESMLREKISERNLNEALLARHRLRKLEIERTARALSGAVVEVE